MSHPPSSPQMATRDVPPFRAEHVGSLLRPREVLQARTDQASGRITLEQRRSIEDHGRTIQQEVRGL